MAAMTPAVQRSTRAVLSRLVTPERTRAILDMAELHQIAADGEEARRVVDQLVHARLLDRARVAHRPLADAAPLARRGAGGRAFLDQLRIAAQQWAARGRPSSLVYSGPEER